MTFYNGQISQQATCKVVCDLENYMLMLLYTVFTLCYAALHCIIFRML